MLIVLGALMIGGGIITGILASEADEDGSIYLVAAGLCGFGSLLCLAA